MIRLFSPPVVAAGAVAHVRASAAQLGFGTTPRALWNDAIPWREAQRRQLPPPIRIGSVARRTAAIDYEDIRPAEACSRSARSWWSTLDPFGMGRSLTAVGSADRLTVVPAVVDLPTAVRC